MKSLKPIVLSLLIALVIGVCVSILLNYATNDLETSLRTYEKDNARLNGKVDSLDAQLDKHKVIDTVLVVKYKEKLVHDTARIEAVKNLPTTAQVEYFSDKTNSECSLIADTSDVGEIDTAVICPTMAIRNANILFIEGQTAKENVIELGVIVKSKDVIINDQSQIIDVKDSLNILKDGRIATVTKDLKVEKKKVIKEKVKTGIVILLWILREIVF